jgi:hypothetical protein
MKTPVQWTTAEERALIVDEALGLLENVGMRFGPCDALNALAGAELNNPLARKLPLVTVRVYAPPLTELVVYSTSSAETERRPLRSTLADDLA